MVHIRGRAQKREEASVLLRTRCLHVVAVGCIGLDVVLPSRVGDEADLKI